MVRFFPVALSVIFWGFFSPNWHIVPSAISIVCALHIVTLSLLSTLSYFTLHLKSGLTV